MRLTLPMTLFVLIVGCTPPPEAPEILADVPGYVFTHFEGDGAELVAAAERFETYWDTLDLDASLNDRAVTLPVLTAEEVDDVERPDGVGLEDQVSVGVSRASVHAIDAHISLAMEDNFVCIDADSAKFYRREFLAGEDCFETGSCDLLRTASEVRRETPLIDFWYDARRDYRSLELSDGRRVLVSRSWMPKQAVSDNGNNTWDQNYTVEVVVQHPDHEGQVRQFFAMWASATVSSLGDNLLAVTMKSSIEEGLENAANFMDGVLCKNDRDAPYSREN